MTIFKRILVATTVGMLSTSGAFAQIKEQQPAEFPPSSYKGKQYVDSQGCVFIRAGIDGDVSWIPRVTRARKTICGFTPTLAGQQTTAVAPAPVPEQVEQITIAPTAAPLPAAVPKPVVRAAAKPRPAAPKVVYKPVRQVAPQQPILVQRPPAPKPVISAPRVALDPDTPITVSSQRRIVPRHVAINRVNTRNVVIPHGYKAAWEDDRLNPHRAEQTLAGREQMLLVWTNTVPRRLINQTTGRDVTASEPLVYPYIDIDTQTRELGEVTIMRRNGKVVKRIVRHTAAKTARKPVLSSRSAPEATTPKVKARVSVPKPQAEVGYKRFVQVGYFSNRAKADKAAQYLAGLGMRARIGTVRKGGKSYLAVQAGPFASPDATARALTRLRGVGYAGAVARN